MLMTSSANRPLPEVLAAGAETLPADSHTTQRHASLPVLNKQSVVSAGGSNAFRYTCACRCCTYHHFALAEWRERAHGGFLLHCAAALAGHDAFAEGCRRNGEGSVLSQCWVAFGDMAAGRSGADIVDHRRFGCS